MTSSENSTATTTTTSITATASDATTPTTAIVNKTPPRHNYANPHTPIASIKRPRSSLQRAASASRSSLSSGSDSKQRFGSKNHNNDSETNMTMTPIRTPTAATMTSPAEQALSPMHAVCPVKRENGEKDGMIVKAPTVQTTTTTTTTDVQGQDDSPSTSSWVGRKVDALFSPVLRFLEQSEEDTTCVHNADADATTADLAANTTDTDTHPSTTSSSSSPDSMILSDDRDNNDDHHEHDNDGNISVHSDSSLSMQGVGAPDEDSDEFNPWQFIQSLPPYPLVQHLCPRTALPPKSPDAPAVTLVLDLDETLVHCSVDPVPNADLEFPVDFHGTTYQVHVRLRPHLFTFLEACRGQFEVVLFTASQKIYANELLNRIDPEGKYIQHRLFRESCLAVEGNFLKDLNVLGRDLAQTILVDNSPHAFGYQVDNGIPIESWFDAADDKELLKLERFLRSFGRHQNVPDVRPILRHKFQCQRLVDDAPPFAMYN